MWHRPGQVQTISARTTSTHGGGSSITLTFTVDQIFQSDGTITATGFTGTYCYLNLTESQQALFNSGYYNGGYIGTWAAGSTHTDTGPYMVIFNVAPGIAQLYGTPYGWPEPENGIWNMPVTATFNQAF